MNTSGWYIWCRSVCRRYLDLGSKWSLCVLTQYPDKSQLAPKFLLGAFECLLAHLSDGLALCAHMPAIRFPTAVLGWFFQVFLDVYWLRTIGQSQLSPRHNFFRCCSFWVSTGPSVWWPGFIGMCARMPPIRFPPVVKSLSSCHLHHHNPTVLQFYHVQKYDDGR